MDVQIIVGNQNRHQHTEKGMRVYQQYLDYLFQVNITCNLFSSYSSLTKSVSSIKREKDVYSDLRPLIAKLKNDGWQNEWNGHPGNKLPKVITSVRVRLLAGENCWWDKRNVGTFRQFTARVQASRMCSYLTPAELNSTDFHMESLHWHNHYIGTCFLGSIREKSHGGLTVLCSCTANIREAPLLYARKVHSVFTHRCL